MANTNFLVISISIAALFFGIFAGWFIAKIKKVREEKMLMKNLMEVIEGKRANVLNIDGKEYDASRFVITNEKGVDVIMDLKGGVIEHKKYAKKENNKKRETSEEDFGQIPECPRKDSKRVRMPMPVRESEKRLPGNIPSRIRKFS